MTEMTKEERQERATQVRWEKSPHRRQKEALDRQKNRAKLSSSQQLARLDQRLGKNIGAVKERARLLSGEKNG